MTTNNYQQCNLKKPLKNELSKQLEEEQIYRNGDHMEGYQWGGGGAVKWGESYRE